MLACLALGSSAGTDEFRGTAGGGVLRQLCLRGLTFELSRAMRQGGLAAEGMMPPAPGAAKLTCRSASALERVVRLHHAIAPRWDLVKPCLPRPK